jgi:hypothetical protein
VGEGRGGDLPRELVATALMLLAWPGLLLVLGGDARRVEGWLLAAWFAARENVVMVGRDRDAAQAGTVSLSSYHVTDPAGCRVGTLKRLNTFVTAIMSSSVARPDSS